MSDVTAGNKRLSDLIAFFLNSMQHTYLKLYIFIKLSQIGFIVIQIN